MKSNYVMVVYAAIILVVTTVLLFELHNSTKKEVIERFRTTQYTAVNQLAREIESYLRERTRGVEVLSSFSVIQYRDMEEMAVTIQEYFGYLKSEHVKSISVYDEKGTIIYSTAKDAIGRNYAECDFFRWAKKKENKGKQFVSSLIRAAENQIERIPYFRFVIAAPIYQDVENPQYSKPTHKFFGMVTAMVDLEELLSAFLPLVSPYVAKEHVWILDSTGTVLFQSEHPEMVMRNIHQQDETCTQCHVSFEHVGTILREKQGTTEYQLKDKPKKLASYSSIEYKNISWKIVLNIPSAEVSGFIKKNLILTFILIGVITLTLIGASSFIYRVNRLKIRAQEEAKQWMEKHELEENIAESEKKYRDLVENALVGVYRTNLRGEILFVNEAMVKMLEYNSREEFMQSGALSRYKHPDVRKRLIETLKKEGSVNNFEIDVLTKNGNEKTVLLSATLDGDVLSGMIRDITDRKRAEEELHRKDEHHKAVIENIFKFVPEGVLVLTESLNLLKHNKAFDDIVQKYAPMLGYSEEELAEKITVQLRSKITTGDAAEICITKNNQ